RNPVASSGQVPDGQAKITGHLADDLACCSIGEYERILRQQISNLVIGCYRNFVIVALSDGKDVSVKNLIGPISDTDDSTGINPHVLVFDHRHVKHAGLSGA